MISSRTLAGVLALVTVVLLGGCTADDSKQSSEPLPGAGGLLEKAAASTAEITSAHVALQTKGNVPGLRVRGLEGDLTREGGEIAAKGSGKMKVMGQVVTMEFVLTGDTLYLKGPTGGYQKLPSAVSSSVYDPSAILDPKRGISKVLRSVRDAKTVAREQVSGTKTFKVTGTAPAEVLRGLLPGISSAADVTFWLAEGKGHRPVKAAVSFPGGEGKPPKVLVTLSNVNKPVTVTPPA